MIEEKEKIALVTGAMGGLGTAITARLLESGFTVIATVRLGRLKEAEDWVGQFPKKDYVKLVELDLFKTSEVLGVVKELTGLYNICYLVNNAGITNDASFKNMSHSQWSEVINCNLSSLYSVTHPIYCNMLQREFGRIVNISSINGLKGQFGQVNYSASKAGVIGFTKSLALEGARKGISVNAIAPGYLNTSMTEKMNEDALTKIVDNIPVGRLGNIDEVASLVDYLLSEKANYITGETISINGGQYLS